VSQSTADPGRSIDDHGLGSARERLDAVLEGFNRLSPDELARIGLSRRDPEARAELIEQATGAASRAGRSDLVVEGRRRARDMILRRYQQGAIHPTFLALNWGISQGTTKDRVAIIDALQDAATAAVVVDLVDPDVADALAADAAEIVGLASGMAFEGSLDRAITPPPPGYFDHPIRRIAFVFLAIEAILVGVVAFGYDGSRSDALSALLTGALFTVLVVRRSGQPKTQTTPDHLRGAP
jgi:hypothetical protein